MRQKLFNGRALPGPAVGAVLPITGFGEAMGGVRCPRIGEKRKEEGRER